VAEQFLPKSTGNSALAQPFHRLLPLGKYVVITTSAISACISGLTSRLKVALIGEF
jgi:hypothetical protein